MSNGIEQAIALFDGSSLRLAREIGGDVKRQNVDHWRKSGTVPAERCPALERAVHGKVPCEELRPDLRWFRVPDEAWPWHPSGRPCIDVARDMSHSVISEPAASAA
jgi:DNA-binding transcriptional regulator YdaS (Cro superfamily)